MVFLAISTTRFLHHHYCISVFSRRSQPANQQQLIPEVLLFSSIVPSLINDTFYFLLNRPSIAPAAEAPQYPSQPRVITLALPLFISLITATHWLVLSFQTQRRFWFSPAAICCAVPSILHTPEPSPVEALMLNSALPFPGIRVRTAPGFTYCAAATGSVMAAINITSVSAAKSPTAAPDRN
ncbi:Uncharacterised protein [Serratia proteamaculans]|nr:Uncharacterised protein [Serratia proteamaculans]